MLSVRREPNALPVSWDGSAHVPPLSLSANKHYLTLHTHLLHWALIISCNPPHELGCCFPPFCLPLPLAHIKHTLYFTENHVGGEAQSSDWMTQCSCPKRSLRAAAHSFFKIGFGVCLFGEFLEEVSEDEPMLEIIPVVNFTKNKDCAGSSCAESHS